MTHLPYRWWMECFVCLHHDLQISCPSDVMEQVQKIENEVHRFNDLCGRSNNIVVRTRHWFRDAFFEFGKHSQELLNTQIVDSSDLAIVIFNSITSLFE